MFKLINLKDYSYSDKMICKAHSDITLRADVENIKALF